MSNRVLAVVGSANVDLVFETDSFPAPGQTVLGKSFSLFSGGKGANQAVAAAKLGTTVEFIGKIGEDEFGKIVRKSLEESGVGLRRLMTAETTPTGTAGIIVGRDGENSIVVNPGANSHLYPDEVENALEDCGASYVLTQFEIDPGCVQACVGKGRLQVNPAPARPIDADLFRRIDILTPNRLEVESLTGIVPCDQGQCSRCARRLLESGVKTVVITLGSEGSFVATTSFMQLVPTLAVRPVDTTGAGDTFNGALAAFLLEGRDLLNSVLLANAAAALSTTRHGAQSSMPDRKEIQSLLPHDF